MTRNQISAPLPLLLTVLLTALLAAAFSRTPGLVHNIDPVLVRFHILGIEISLRYYGLVYFLGFAAIYGTLAAARARGSLPLGQDQVEIFVFLGFLGMIAGARIFEVVFYDIGRYIKDPLSILKIWNGGLSFHGAPDRCCPERLDLFQEEKDTLSGSDRYPDPAGGILSGVGEMRQLRQRGIVRHRYRSSLGSEIQRSRRLPPPDPDIRSSEESLPFQRPLLDQIKKTA